MSYSVECSRDDDSTAAAAAAGAAAVAEDGDDDDDDEKYRVVGNRRDCDSNRYRVDDDDGANSNIMFDIIILL